MLATISLSGTLANQRHCDVWGAVCAEQDVDAVNPRAQYVANLGHQTDVESNLIYMRARYYDPNTARFVTEDPARDGANWFVYCNNDPVNMVDVDGERVLTAMEAAFWCSLIAGVFSILAKQGTLFYITGQIDSARQITESFMEALVVAYVMNLFIASSLKSIGRLAFWRMFGISMFGGAVSGAGIGIVLAMTAGFWSSAIVMELFYIEYCI